MLERPNIGLRPADVRRVEDGPKVSVKSQRLDLGRDCVGAVGEDRRADATRA